MKTHRLYFAGTILAIECEGEGADRIVDYLYRDIPRTDLDPPHVTYRLVQDDKADALYLYRGDEPEHHARSEGEMAGYLLDRIVYHLANHSRTGLVFHAAALAWEGRGLLLPGPSGSGKTTLTAWLLTQGFDYLTDELVFIASDTTQMQGLARPLNVKKKGKAALQEIFGHQDLPREMVTSSTRRIFPLSAFGPGHVLDSIPLHCIMFPRFSPQGLFELRGLSKAKNAATLMACLINARNLPDQGFSEVVRLARTTPGYELRYGGVDQIGEAIAKTMRITG
jgi:hypothetical protein